MFYSVGWSTTMIPYDALAMELTSDYLERTSLFGWKGSCAMLGQIAAGVVGIVFASLYPNDVGMQVLVPGVAFAVVVAAAFTSLLAVVPEPRREEQQLAAQLDQAAGPVPMCRRLWRNPLYRTYLQVRLWFLVLKYPMAENLLR
jgi:Na+/melibiose symporter-like transporter